ncbi:hypothetical protein ACNQGB_04315 [Flavobacterium sp. XS1P32]|uniref:hypothetical protein n=1 Tax=Flavobacterium sp. XS1P32 TaxID=3401726 RepID=UPI003AABF9F3
MNLKQQEKLFKELLDKHFLPKGFIYFHEYQNTNYRKFNDEITLQNTLYATSSGWHSFVNEISFKKTEKIIYEIGLPNIDFSTYSKNDLTCTIRDNEFDIKFPTKGIHPIETEADCIEYCQRIVNYMENEGKQFIEKYSYLPNVLSEMDRLESEGKYWKEILAGGPENLFKGLIIAKLCNDINFQKKLNYVDKIFYDDPDEWIPYYEKLKERLKTVMPIYNI